MEMIPPEVCEIRTVWSFESSVPLVVMKPRSAGICSRSDGTFGLSRSECTLSNCRMTTCWIPFPRLHVDIANAVPGESPARPTVHKPTKASPSPNSRARTPTNRAHITLRHLRPTDRFLTVRANPRTRRATYFRRVGEL